VLMMNLKNFNMQVFGHEPTFWHHQVPRVMVEREREVVQVPDIVATVCSEQG
jgi:hypothetical protein